MDIRLHCMVPMLFFLVLGWPAHCGYAVKDSQVIESIDTVCYRDYKDNTTLTSSLTSTETGTKEKGTDSESQTYSQLLEEVFNYVSRTSKRSCAECKEIATEITHKALNNNIDICFILAQGTTETHLGTTGIGKTRHSIFGIYRTYKTYTDCITAYVSLLKRNYLVSRTEQQLLKKYVDKDGKRYAANRNYEKHISKAYRKIRGSTNIYSLQLQAKQQCN